MNDQRERIASDKNRISNHTGRTDTKKRPLKEEFVQISFPDVLDERQKNLLDAKKRMRETAKEYEAGAMLIYERISHLREELILAKGDDARAIQQRIYVLYGMYIDAMKTAREIYGYYGWRCL